MFSKPLPALRSLSLREFLQHSGFANDVLAVDTIAMTRMQAAPGVENI